MGNARIAHANDYDQTSCDDTSVAAVNVKCLPTDHNFVPQLKVRFHEKTTANNDAYSGIHPLVALDSHQKSLAPMVQRALAVLDRSPQLICVTRGPGMRSNLSVGLDTAKGLALALNVPLIGVNHMQAHALTPRLVHAMANAERAKGVSGMGVEYPFLTTLVSGGHTLLLNSKNGIEHELLAETEDTAIGDCIDKAARAILPVELLKVPYGKALEDFAFPGGERDYDYTPPKRREDEIKKRQTKFNWAVGPPLANSKVGGKKSSRRMVYSFAGLLTGVERFLKYECDACGNMHHVRPRSPNSITIEERHELAREVQRVTFEHLASRIMLHLGTLDAQSIPKTLVVSGGVASNRYLRHVLRSILDVRGFGQVRLNFPPVELCTDNALMIAWAGYEMASSGYRSELGIQPLRKWSLDPGAADCGILGVGGWCERDAQANLLNLTEYPF